MRVTGHRDFGKLMFYLPNCSVYNNGRFTWPDRCSRLPVAALNDSVKRLRKKNTLSELK